MTYWKGGHGESSRIMARQYAKNIEKMPRQLVGLNETKIRWTKTFNISLQSKSINWEVFVKSYESLPERKNVWSAKYKSRIGSVMQNLQRHKHAETSGCPNCGEVENIDHVFTCASEASNTTYTTQREILTRYLHNGTSPNLQQCSLKSERDLVCNSEWDEPFKKLATKQYALGQLAFFGGFWINEIVSAQLAYLRKIGSRKTEK